MKKRTMWIAVVIHIFGALGVVKAREYYVDRYVGSDYYTKAPMDLPTTLTDIYDNQQKVVGKGRSYTFESYNEALEKRNLEFTYDTEDPARLIQPGQYIKISASRQIVVGQVVVNKDAVPQNILNVLDKQ